MEPLARELADERLAQLHRERAADRAARQVLIAAGRRRLSLRQAVGEALVRLGAALAGADGTRQDLAGGREHWYSRTRVGGAECVRGQGELAEAEGRM